MQDLAGKVAVITGAGDGMGRAIALAFAGQGMHIVAADIDDARLTRVGSELRALGVDVLLQRTDVADREQVRLLCDASYARFKQVHLLVNNAGVVGSLSTRLRDIDLRTWDWVLDINLKGVVYGLHYFLPRMLDSGVPGHIVNTASMAGLSSGMGGGAYTASKHAVVAISRSLKAETEGTQIGVSVLWDLNDVTWSIGYDHLNYISTGKAANTETSANNNVSALEHSVDQISTAALLKLSPTIGLGIDGTASSSKYPKNPRGDGSSLSGCRARACCGKSDNLIT